MPAAVVGGAIAAAGTIGGVVIANKGTSKAAKATQASADTAAAVQTRNYDLSAAALAPYRNAGIPATSAINALLGLGGVQQQQPAMQQQQVMPNALSQFRGGTSPFGKLAYMGDGGGILPAGAGYGIADGQAGLGTPYYGATQQTQPAQTAQQAANGAFDIFRNSTGYQFRVNEGMDALNSGYAASGALQSGDALRSLDDYRQGMASSEFGNYLNALGNQQALGLSAASAQAGVGQNYANSIGNIYMAQGQNQANSALLKSANIGNAAAGVANIAGGLFGGQNNYNALAYLTPSVNQTIANNPSIF